MSRYYPLHEVEKLPSSSSWIMGHLHLPVGHLQGGEQGGRSVTLIAVAESVQRFAIRQSQPTLGPFQDLTVRFLIDTHHHGILRWMQIQTHDIGGLAGKLGIGGNAQTPPSLQLNLMLA